MRQTRNHNPLIHHKLIHAMFPISWSGRNPSVISGSQLDPSRTGAEMNDTYPLKKIPVVTPQKQKETSLTPILSMILISYFSILFYLSGGCSGPACQKFWAKVWELNLVDLGDVTFRTSMAAKETHTSGG